MAPKKKPQPDKKYLEAIRRLTHNVNRDFLSKVEPTSFIGDKGEDTLLKVWPGTDKEWENKVEAFQSLYRKAYGKDASKKAIADNFGVRVIDGQLQIPTGGKWTTTKNTGERAFKKLGSKNRSWRVLNEWVQTPGKYSKEALNFAFNDVRSKPILEALGKVVPSGQVHQHHLFLLEILKPFTQNAQGGVRSPEEISVLFNTLAKRGFFSGNLDENLVWLTQAQHLDETFSVHNILQGVTDIQGRGLDDEAVKWINVAIDGDVQRFPKTAETAKKLKALQKQGKVVEKVSYHLGDDLSRTYQIGAKHGFADEFLDQLRNETDITKVANYLDEFAGTVEEGLTGAVKVAKELYPATGDVIRRGGPLAAKLGGPLDPSFLETLKTMKADPKDTAKLGELAARNQQLINKAKQGINTGIQSVDDVLTGQPSAFALADGGVMSKAAALPISDEVGGTARALGVMQQKAGNIVKASNLRRYENVQNLKAFARPGTTIGRRVAALMPVVGAAGDVWDVTERYKKMMDDPNEGFGDALDKFQFGLAVGTAATNWWAEPVNFVAGLTNLGIDAGRYTHKLITNEEARDELGHAARSLGMQGVRGITEFSKSLL